MYMVYFYGSTCDGTFSCYGYCSFDVVCVVGSAGIFATFLHDAVMNPADGRSLATAPLRVSFLSNRSLTCHESLATGPLRATNT